MPEKLPAVVTTPDPTTAEVDSWIPIASDVIKLANLIAPTEFVPRAFRDSAPATAAAILYGREVGLPPMTSLTQVYVIEGRPAMYAEGMRAVVLAAGHEIEVVESTRARCELRGRRRGRERWETVTWTIDEVRHLINKGPWTQYPRQMLQARASAELCRLVFPDVIHGFRAVEEFDDHDLEATLREEPPAPTTTIAPRKTTRKRAPRKTTPPPLEARSEPIEGPPLPGDPNYQTSVGDSSPIPRESTDAEPGTAPGEPPTDPQTSSSTAAPRVEETEEPPRGDRVGDPAGGSEDTAVSGDTAGKGREAGGGPLGDLPAGLPDDRGPRPATRAQHRMIHGLLDEIHGRKIEDRYRWELASLLTGRDIGSFNDLTHSNASAIIETLGRVHNEDELAAVLEAFREQGEVTTAIDGADAWWADADARRARIEAMSVTRDQEEER